MSDKVKAQPPAATATAGNPDESLDFLAPRQAADELGRLAHYRILRVLGRGGMGTVFMAEDTRLHRLVALKVMLPSVAKKKVAYDRFKREAEVTAKIDHDHIVTIYEVGEDRGIPYLAMQFLKGMSLEDWLKAGKTLNVPQIMRIGKEIAKGLAAAHACQLIHRDIKPSNIWLDATNKGRVKILDFGLARPTDEDTHLTQEGIILGSPAFMSPEQARGQAIDERSDLFSLGCVLYRLCTGRLPFLGKDTMSMLLAITQDQPPPVQQFNAGVPPAMMQLINQMLAKKPQDRPESARVVVQALQNIERDWLSNTKTVALPKLEAAAPAAGKAPSDPELEDSAITEMELMPALAPTSRSTRWTYIGIFAGLASLLLVVVSLACCMGGLILYDHGEVRIIAEDDAALAHLEGVGVTVLNHHKKTFVIKGPQAQRLPSGGYYVEAGSLPRDMVLTPDPFTLHRGVTVELKLKLVPAIPSGSASKPEPPPLQRVTDKNARPLQEQWARYLRRPVVETNSIDMNLVLIPPGEFEMGSAAEFVKQYLSEAKKLEKKLIPEIVLDKYRAQLPAESPAHVVRITRPFALGMYEVTVDDFIKFVAAEKYVTQAEKQGGGTGPNAERNAMVQKPQYSWNNTGFNQSKRQPVCNITWGDAAAFCRWLSRNEKKVYRLPTEAEWEYACRAGTTTPWSFGADGINAHEYIHSFRPLEYSKNIGAHKVGTRKANDFGLYDMHGNVEEMCADTWGANYYANSPQDDPRGPPEGRLRVMRGGHFLTAAIAARSAYRDFSDSSLGCVHIGFRVVCEVSMD